MNTFIGEEQWKMVENNPDYSGAGPLSFIKWLQAELKWTFQQANEFLKQVEPPPFEGSQWSWLRERAKEFDAKLQKPPIIAEPVEPVGFDFKCDSCGMSARVEHHDQQEAIAIARSVGWLIRGSNQTGPDDCPICKKKLEQKCGRKIRGDGSFE